MTANNSLGFQSGFALQDGAKLDKLAALSGLSAQGNLTAAADTTRASATALTSGCNEVGTVAGAADSVILPLAKAGTVCFVSNNGANAMNVFAQGTDTIDGTAGSTGVSQTNAVNAIYFCAVDGEWEKVTGA